jgi:hypothetical protein
MNKPPAPRTCATCRFWGPPVDDTRADLIEMREDEATQAERAHLQARAVDPLHRCLRVVAYHEDGALAAPACAVDGEGWHASLRTRASFGCSLHEEKA